MKIRFWERMARFATQGPGTTYFAANTACVTSLTSKLDAGRKTAQSTVGRRREALLDSPTGGI
jgi:hypothetical protein